MRQYNNFVIISSLHQNKMQQIFLHPFNLRSTGPSTYHAQNHQSSRSNLSKNVQHITTSLHGSQKHISTPNEYGLSSHHTIQSSRLKNPSHHGKNLSKKLFQRAKIIKDPTKQTFLSTSQKHVQKNSHQGSTSSSQIFLQIPKQTKNRCRSAKRQRSTRKINADGSEEQIPLSCTSLRKKSGNSNSSNVFTTQDQELKIDAEESKLIEENNLFNSQAGQSLLCNLKRNLSNISSIEKKRSNDDIEFPKKQRQHHKSSRNIGFQIRKVQSYQIDNQYLDPFNPIHEQPKINIRQSHKQVKRLSSFSQLIMEDQYEFHTSMPTENPEPSQSSSSENRSNKNRR